MIRVVGDIMIRGGSIFGFKKLFFVMVFFIASVSVLFAEQFVVVIDAGHGGKDPGAIGRNYKLREKVVNLDIALTLGNYIKQNHKDVKVIYTRSTDVFVNLSKRADIANKAKANLFISIHCNSSKARYLKGSEVYILGVASSKENLDIAKQENSVILLEEDYKTRYEGFDPQSSESYIVFEMMQSTYTLQSMNFAKHAQKQFCGSSLVANKGVRQAGFLVLRETAMPSVLVEVGYLSNQKEELSLSSHENRVLLSKSIYNAFVEYKKSFDKSSKVETEKKSKGK